MEPSTCGIAVLIGFQTRLATLLLIAFTVIATLIAHRFWDFQGAQRPMQQTQFFKNLAIIGGFVALWASGPGRYAVDRLTHRDPSRVDRILRERPVTERRIRERRQKIATVPEVT